MGCRVSFGSPKLKGGLGATRATSPISPPRTRKGVKVFRRDAPLPKFRVPLRWDTNLGYRVR